jgi:hypothetical protein
VLHLQVSIPSWTLKQGADRCDKERADLWIHFESTRPIEIKILLGDINAISGEPTIETFATALCRARLTNEKKSIQDYVVINPADKGLLWFDSIARLNGKVMQFV